MGRIVAISSGDLESTKPINEYAIKMINSMSKNVLFISTASNDSEEYIKNFTKAFLDFGCIVRTLKLVTKKYTIEEIKEIVY